MTVGSDEKNVLDGGAIPPISTKNENFQYHCNLFYTDREWSRSIGWGPVPPERTMGMNSFDRASSIQVDSPKDD
jgi:hypothetical protein